MDRAAPHPVTIRLAESSDRDAWIRLRDALWPGTPDDHRSEVDAFLSRPSPRDACFLAVAPEGAVIGFAEARLREYADGCVTSPVGYLEGIWVEPDHRRTRVGEALVAAVEGWARSRGCTEMASDRALDNEASGRFHEAAGFEEVERAVLYRKALDPGALD
ncbi:aminoglycoside 6'-N-acetyltransferase [Gemmatimonadota bacterium Y43]